MTEFRPYGAYIVACQRSAGGKKNGRLRNVHPISLLAQTIDVMMEKTLKKEQYGLVDDLICGNVMQVGEHAGNIGRNAVLACKTLPESVPGTTVDRQCGSSQQSLHFAAQAVMSGFQDIVIAGGVESMTRVPIGASIVDGFKAGHGKPMSGEMTEKYGQRLKERGLKDFSQFEGAEILCEKYGISRADCENLAVLSHARAAEATEKGYFKREIAVLKGEDKEGKEVLHDKDEGIRKGTNLAQLQKMKTLKELQSKGEKKGFITAALASQICDGASCILICNEKGLEKLGIKPRAKIIGMSVAGSDPVAMLDGPIPATQKVLAQTGMTIEQMEIYELNEAFASVPLSWAKMVKADINKLNVNGGAMALGHPLGATGTKIMTTMVHEMERRNLKYGLQAICEGGGTANATIIERLDSVENIKAKL